MHDAVDLLSNSGIGHVWIRLVRIKCVVIIRTCFLIKVLFSISLVMPKHDMIIMVLWLCGRPNVVITIWSIFVFSRLLKPRMLIRSVIHHQIHKYTNAFFLCYIYQFSKFTKFSDTLVYFVIIPDIIAVVLIR